MSILCEECTHKFVCAKFARHIMEELNMRYDQHVGGYFGMADRF